MHATQRVTQRNDMVLKYFPLVRATAIKLHRRLPAQVDLDDLISAGFMGLIEAVDRFEPDRNVPLASFARRRIYGAIVDSLRASDWVPRTVRDKVAVLTRARGGLQDRLGRAPTGDEVAERLGISVEAYRAMVRAAEVRTLVSMDAPLGGGDTRLMEVLPSDDDLYEATTKMQAKRLVSEAMVELTPREREAVSLYYYHDLSFRESGEILGISESRVCQLCASAVKRLRNRLQPLAA